MSGTRDSPGSGATTWDETSTDRTPSVAVVSAVADVTGRSPLEMDPLADAIDPDALDGLVGSNAAGDAATTVTFEYCGCRVSLSPAELRITRLD